MEDIVEYLELFNRKLSKLLSLSFSEKLDKLDVVYSQNGHSLYIFKSGVRQSLEPPRFFKDVNAVPGVSVNGPTGEEFDSYILTVRFFIQNNDMLSIANWMKKIDTAEVDDSLKLCAHNLRTDLNNVLDSPRMNVKLKSGRVVLTARDVIETYVYGEYAHSNPKKNSLYNEIGFSDNNLSFILCTRELSNVFKQIKDFNESVIQNLRKLIKAN